MNDKNIKIVAIVAVLVIGAVIGTILINSGDNDSDDQSADQTGFTQNTVTDTTTDEQGNTVTSKTSTITITENGYSPQNIEIEQGTTVVFENESGPDRWPASNDHPTHLIYPEFDPQEAITAGSSWSFQFNKVGDWGYHDHLRDEITGTIRVVEATPQSGQSPTDQTSIPTEPDFGTGGKTGDLPN